MGKGEEARTAARVLTPSFVSGPSPDWPSPSPPPSAVDRARVSAGGGAARGCLALLPHGGGPGAYRRYSSASKQCIPSAHAPEQAADTPFMIGSGAVGGSDRGLTEMKDDREVSAVFVLRG